MITTFGDLQTNLVFEYIDNSKLIRRRSICISFGKIIRIISKCEFTNYMNILSAHFQNELSLYSVSLSQIDQTWAGIGLLHDETKAFPDSKVHGATHLGPVGPSWAPCWPHEPCYQGFLSMLMRHQLHHFNIALVMCVDKNQHNCIE